MDVDVISKRNKDARNKSFDKRRGLVGGATSASAPSHPKKKHNRSTSVPSRQRNPDAKPAAHFTTKKQAFKKAPSQQDVDKEASDISITIVNDKLLKKNAQKKKPVSTAAVPKPFARGEPSQQQQSGQTKLLDSSIYASFRRPVPFLEREPYVQQPLDIPRTIPNAAEETSVMSPVRGRGSLSAKFSRLQQTSGGVIASAADFEHSIVDAASRAQQQQGHQRGGGVSARGRGSIPHNQKRDQRQQQQPAIRLL